MDVAEFDFHEEKKVEEMQAHIDQELIREDRSPFIEYVLEQLLLKHKSNQATVHFNSQLNLNVKSGFKL
jgi:hypothetical protein